MIKSGRSHRCVNDKKYEQSSRNNRVTAHSEKKERTKKSQTEAKKTLKED